MKNKFLLFLVYLQQVKHLAYGTIQVYSAAVRSWFVVNGLPDSSIGQAGAKDPLLRLLLQGIKRTSVGSQRVERKPITMPKLIKFVDAIDLLEISILEKTRLKTLILLSFWGLFRGSELCKSSGRKNYLRRKDVRVCRTGEGISYVKVVLRGTKTCQFKRTAVYIYENETKYCAVSTAATYFKITKSRSDIGPNSHFFSWGTRVMSLRYFNIMIKLLASKIGLKPKFYSSHCFRAGGATSATNRGIPPHVIKQMGRWSSNCFELYVKKPREALRKAQRSIIAR